MDFFAKWFCAYRRSRKAIDRFLLISGPGIIVMIADNDAGEITTYRIIDKDVMNLKRLLIVD